MKVKLYVLYIIHLTFIRDIRLLVMTWGLLVGICMPTRGIPDSQDRIIINSQMFSDSILCYMKYYNRPASEKRVIKPFFTRRTIPSEKGTRMSSSPLSRHSPSIVFYTPHRSTRLSVFHTSITIQLYNILSIQL